MAEPTLSYGELLYGLRELQIAPIDSSGVQGSWIAWSGVSLEAGVEVETAQQNANDRVIGTARTTTHGTLSAEAGHMPSEVAEALYGLDRLVAGSGSSETVTLTVNADDAMPAFALRARVRGGKGDGNTGGGDAVFETIGTCYVTGGFGPSFSGGSFWSPGVEAIVVPDSAGDIFKLTQRATAAPLS
jgi:hypothetical protein